MPGLQPAGDPAALPLLTGLLVGYLPWVVGTGMLLAFATLASAIGCCCASTGHAARSSAC